MTIKNINPEYIFEKAKALHEKINEFYDRAADVLQGINRHIAPLNLKNAKSIPIPFSMFYLYHKELNNLMKELSLEFDEIVDSVQLTIQNVWQGYNTEKTSPELKEAVSQVLVALENLKTSNDRSNPIDGILATDSQLHVSELQWQAPVITDLMAALDAVLSKAEQDISNAEKSKSGAKNNTSFLHIWQKALAPLRQAGLLERNFSVDLAHIIRQEVKNTYQTVEQQIKKTGQYETQY